MCVQELIYLDSDLRDSNLNGKICCDSSLLKEPEPVDIFKINAQSFPHLDFICVSVLL